MMKKCLYPLALLAMPLGLHAATSASRGTFEPQAAQYIVCKIKTPLGDVTSDTIRFIHYDSLGKPYAMQTTTELAYPIVRQHCFFPTYEKVFVRYQQAHKKERFPYNNIDEYMYVHHNKTLQKGIEKMKTHISFWNGQAWIKNTCPLAQLPLYAPKASQKLVQHMSKEDQELLTQSLQQGCIGRISGFSMWQSSAYKKEDYDREMKLRKDVVKAIGCDRPITEYYYPQYPPLKTSKGGQNVDAQLDPNAVIGLFALIITFFGGLYYGSKRNVLSNPELSRQGQADTV